MKARTTLVLILLTNFVWVLAFQYTNVRRNKHESVLQQQIQDDRKARDAEHALAGRELDATLSELAAANNELDEIRRELIIAREAAQPCPAVCGTPELSCRKILVMMDVLNGCLSFHDQIKANLRVP